MLGYYKLSKKIKSLFATKKYKQSYNFDFQKKKDSLYIFGNGYSIKDFDLNTIVNQDCFICNAFFRMPGFDEFIKNNNIVDFSLDGFEKLLIYSIKINIKIEDLFDGYVNPKIGLNFPLVKTADFIPYIIKKNPDQSIITSTALLEKYTYPTNKKKIEEIIDKIGHTPQFMILIGILMEYKKIFLYGLEHNYVKDILNKDSICGTHFYDDSYRSVLELDRGVGLTREEYKIKLSELFEGNSHVFRTYEQLAELAKEMGIEVIDHSNGSLFMFQDYSLWDLVEEKK
jgi:hypothetical protein